jgi:mono/diheme cytochrome c family protein
MVQRAILAALAIVLAIGCTRSEEVAPTGQLLYVRHCASCHGVAGEGNGPLASSLLRPPVDLTRIGERSDGSFDEARVMSIIDGRRAVREHGTREMPVWGAVFEEKLQGKRYSKYTVLLQGRALTDYLRSIQREQE